MINFINHLIQMEYINIIELDIQNQLGKLEQIKMFKMSLKNYGQPKN